MSNIEFNANKTKSLISSINDKYQEAEKLLNEIIMNYESLDKKVWLSYEKDKLDAILLPYFKNIDNFNNDAKSIVKLLKFYDSEMNNALSEINKITHL